MAETKVSPWMGTTDAAKYAKRHSKTVIRALRHGELRGYQGKQNGSWRVHVDDLDAWIRGEAPARRRKSA